MIHKPMLAATVKDPYSLRFPLVATPKIDGIRAFVRDGTFFSRTGKRIPNNFIQTIATCLPEGLDGELVVGSNFQQTTSGVMTREGKPDFYYHAFDLLSNPNEVYYERLARLHVEAECPRTVVVPYDYVNSVDQLLAYEHKVLMAGYEGVCLRKPNSPYKQGRSTLKEHYLLKLKRFTDSEAWVEGVEELLHNNNPLERNELGYAKRSSHQENKTGAGMMGKLLCRDCYSNVEFAVGTGFSEEERRYLWHDPPIGRVIKYKSFKVGEKDKPRHPVFLGWRHKEDL